MPARDRTHGLYALLSGIALFCAAPATLSAQQIRARTVDEQTRQPLRDVTVLLLANGATVATATTGGDGFFRLRAPAAGTFELAVQRPGYADVRREVAIAGRDTTLAAFVLAPEAIALDSLAVQARRRPPETDAAGFVRPSHILAGERLLRLEDLGGTVYTAVREIGAIRMREFQTPGGRRVTCLESNRRFPTFSERSPGSTDCPRHIVIVLDGMVVPGPENLLRTIQLLDLESITYLTPAEAGFRYGTAPSLFGALVLWSRGRGPFASDERNRR